MRNDGSDIEFVHKYLREMGMKEFPFLALTRQGFRSAVEVLADATMKEGNNVSVGVHLSGARAAGSVNIITLRVADKEGDIPSGIYPVSPTGLFVTHESFLTSETLWKTYPGVSRSISASTTGTLMICTSKPPEEMEYPLDFEGTVATVDAEAIFAEKVAIKPAPFGITALGLFIRATDGLVSLDAVKGSILEFERLNKRTRELNAETVEIAYEQTKVVHDVKIKGKLPREKFEDYARGTGITSFRSAIDQRVGAASGDEPGYAWRDKLPVCDQRKCRCIECLAAYYCPEAAISWRQEVYHVDYDFCKGCGTCAVECTEDAITMEPAEEVLASLSKR